MAIKNIKADVDLAQEAHYQLSNFEVTGTGSIRIINTGGSSASEGGMGTGGGPEKGAGIEGPNGKEDAGSGGKVKDDESWDPLKPKEEKEKGK